MNAMKATGLMVSILSILISYHFWEKSSQSSTDSAKPAIASMGAGLFIPNEDQWSHQALYAAKIGGMTVLVEKHGWTMSILDHPIKVAPLPPLTPVGPNQDEEVVKGVGVRMAFEAAEDRATIEPSDKKFAKFNYFLGSNPEKWRTNICGYDVLTYSALYDGVNLSLHRGKAGLQYDLEIQPGVDISNIRVKVEGNEGLRLTADGELIIDTHIGPIMQSKPLAWELLPSGDKRLTCAQFSIIDTNNFQILIEDRDRALALVIDPELTWSTYIGGSDGEGPSQSAVDQDGNIVFAGICRSSDYPTTIGAFSRIYAGGRDRMGDAIVTKLSHDGNLLWSTYIGGGDNEYAYTVACGPGNLITVAGSTLSSDYPVTSGSFSTQNAGPLTGGMYGWWGGDCFITRLAPAGDRIVWSTFVGGKGHDLLIAMSVDVLGNVYFGGCTNNISYAIFDFPTTPGAYMQNYPPGSPGAAMGFLGKLSSNGKNLAFSSYLGGEYEDWVSDLRPTMAGDVAVLGNTNSQAFPVTAGAFQSTYRGLGRGEDDCFFCLLDPSGSQLKASTYFGGSLKERAYMLQECSSGDFLFVGNTRSNDLPISGGSFQTAFTARVGPGGPTTEPGSGFIACIDSGLSKLKWSTFLGGGMAEHVKRFTFDSNADILATGVTYSTDFPVTPGAHFTTYGDPYPAGDAFLIHMEKTGRRLLWSTFLGGNDVDNGLCADLDKAGLVYILGNTRSTNFPVTPMAYDTSYNGDPTFFPDGDCFATKLKLGHIGVRRYGADTPSCLGAVTIYTERAPRSGEAKFGFACWGAPPNTSGLLLISGGGLMNPIRAIGADFWVSPVAAPFVTVLVGSDNNGKCTVPLPLPKGIKGARCYTQFVWVNTPSCPGSGVLCASDALEVTFQ